MAFGATILGTGMYHPPREVTNHDLAAIMDTSDEWIQQRSGIVMRRFVDEGMTTSDLAYEATKEALDRADMSASDLDLILVASFTSDHFFPGVSSFLQEKLGCETTPAMDLKVQCTGFVYALKTAHAFIVSGQYERVLVVGAEVHSHGLEFSDYHSCHLKEMERWSFVLFLVAIVCTVVSGCLSFCVSVAVSWDDAADDGITGGPAWVPILISCFIVAVIVIGSFVGFKNATST